MARLPFKIVRFLVWCAADSTNRDDALTALDERFVQVYDEYGPAYAHWWSLSQALRSMPYGFIANLLRLALIIWAWAS